MRTHSIYIVIIILLSCILWFKGCDKPTPTIIKKNYIKEVQVNTKVFTDSINKLQADYSKLQKQKGKIKLIPYAVLQSYVVPDSSCKPLVDTLLSEIAKERVLLKIDSSMIKNLQDENHLLVKKDSVTLKELMVCQKDNDTLVTNNVKLIADKELMSKKVTVIGAIFMVVGSIISAFIL
jgi:hypothetical protein